MIISLHLSLTFPLCFSTPHRLHHALELQGISGCRGAATVALIDFAELPILRVNLLEKQTRRLESVTVQVVDIRLSSSSSLLVSRHAMQIFAIIVNILQRANDLVAIRDKVVFTQMLRRHQKKVNRALLTVDLLCKCRSHSDELYAWRKSSGWDREGNCIRSESLA